MSKNLIPLNQLPTGSFGKVKKMTAEGVIRRRLLDLGLIYNTSVVSLMRSPSGDPTAYEIRGTVIALRIDEASNILVESI